MSTQTIHLQLTLTEPLVLSQSNATEGAHQSLDYIPGATILGAIAAKHYRQFKQQGKAYDLFHSGKVRFHNAYPLVKGQPSYPVPLSLHYDKLGDKKAPINYLQKTFAEPENQPHQDITQVIQGKQHRKGYIAATDNHQAWCFFEPEKTLQMRTAINPKQGKAQEGQLYGYQLLKAGTQYLAQISCDEAELAQQLEQVLNSQKDLLIGRSRSAQYGKVQLSVQAAKRHQPHKPVIKIDDKDHLVLWLASDMAIYNQYGQPTLAPSLQDLGLSVIGKFVSAKSFVRTRQYAPYNGFRKTYDLERQVLTQGSILTYKLDSELTDADMQTLQKGLGAYTESGLGQIVLDDSFRLLEQGDISLQTYASSSAVSGGQQPDTALIAYLTEQAEQRQIDAKYAKQIDELLAELKKLYQSARNYNGLMPGQPFGPGKSQWGAVRNYATQSKSKQDLQAKLFEGQDAFIKEKDQDWGVSTGKETFRSWLLDLVKKETNDLVLIRGLAFKVTQDKTLLNLMEGK